MVKSGVKVGSLSGYLVSEGIRVKSSFPFGEKVFYFY